MRLIDADKIYQILENKSSYGYVSAMDISSIEIVKAIPIEWIKKWNQKNENFLLYMGLARKLIEDWEKENDRR